MRQNFPLTLHTFQAAVLLETLLLDALVARPEASAGLTRGSGAIARSGTVSPRRGWVAGVGVGAAAAAAAAAGESLIASGAGRGLVLSEADQRVLQVCDICFFLLPKKTRACFWLGVCRENEGIGARRVFPPPPPLPALVG